MSDVNRSPPRVDCQSHVFPAAYAELFLRNTGGVRATSPNAGTTIFDYAGLQQFNLKLEDYAPERKLRDMDAAGVDISVLSVNIPGPEYLDEDLMRAGARACNEYVAELCAQHPQRFVGIANLPLQNMAAALIELDDALDRLGLRGVMMPSNVCGKPLDAPEFEPLYARLEQRGVPLVLHPTVPSWSAVIQDHSMIPMFGFMVDTSIAMLRLILGGVLERHPNLQVVHPHAGGVLPYVMGRVEEQTEVKKRGNQHITRPPSTYYQRVYLDLVSPSPLALRYAYDFAGPERLLFASDHPWVSVALFMEMVEAMTIPQVDKDKILGLNACKLFKIPT